MTQNKKQVSMLWFNLLKKSYWYGLYAIKPNNVESFVKKTLMQLLKDGLKLDT